MDAILEKINASQHSSFSVNEIRLDYFLSPWHYHPEVEIMLITEGHGTRLIGDSIGRFDAGEMAIIGANLPHVWLNDQSFYQENNPVKAGAIFIQFREDLWGKSMLQLPEMKAVNQLMEKARRGLRITGSTREHLQEKMRIIAKAGGALKLSLLLDMLTILSEQFHNLQPLSSVGFSAPPNDAENKRMNTIYSYLVKNYQREIALQEVARLVNMSPTSFCRYFKSRTNKTLFRFINEMRIGHACKLLIDNELNVTEICYASGFNHFSNFHKQFLAVKGTAPLKYRQRYVNRK